MQLLGTYNSNLAAYQYQQLLALLQAAISSGDLSSGSSFDKTTLLQLEQQATNFSNLPLATAGTRAQDESLLQPISLLKARFQALASETDSFITRSQSLISFLQAETDLLDNLLAADSLQNWVARLPALANSQELSWDFSTGQGRTSVLLPPTDPSNGVLYTNEFTTGNVFDVSAGVLSSGILAPSETVSIVPKNLKWKYPSVGTTNELYGPDMSWAELTLVEDLPQVDFTAQPAIKIILPINQGDTSFISVTGQVPGGALPTYLRLLFYPRSRKIQTKAKKNQVYTLSRYTIDPDSVIIYEISDSGVIGSFYQSGTDYSVDQTGSITPITFDDNIQVVINFSENFPAYQCSVDQENWSNIYMLDPNRPFRDDETNFTPIDIKESSDGAQFPLTDETGTSTGLFFKLTKDVTSDYTLLITTPGATSYGPTCELQVDLEQPKFCTGLYIKPFSSAPARLVAVELEGLTSATRTLLFSGSALIDRAVEIRFPRQLVTSVYLTFIQENYTITEYQELSTDALRRSTMATIEASLPFSLGQYIPPVSTTKRGYEYTLGFESIEARDSQTEIPGVLVQGPFLINGRPTAVRFDAELSGTIDTYLCYVATNAAGVVIDRNDLGVQIVPNKTVIMPYTGGTTVADIVNVQLSLRCVFRTAGSVFTRYNLQVALQ